MRFHRNLSTIKEYAELIGAILVVLGAGMAYLQYVDAKEKEQQDLGERAYGELQDSYFDMMQVCLQYPMLDCSDSRPAGAVCLTVEEERQQQIIYGMIISVFERAWLRYEVARPPRYAEQWPGWVRYMEAFARGESFRRVWVDVADTYDAGFHLYLDALLQRVPVTPAAPCVPR